MLNKLITKLAQNLGNHIINKMESSDDEEMVDYLYEMGLMLNSFCINVFGIYLD